MHIKELFLKKGLSFSLFYIRLLNTKQIEEKREFRIATRKTNPIHNDVSEIQHFYYLTNHRVCRLDHPIYLIQNPKLVCTGFILWARSVCCLLVPLFFNLIAGSRLFLVQQKQYKSETV